MNCENCRKQREKGISLGKYLTVKDPIELNLCQKHRKIYRTFSPYQKMVTFYFPDKIDEIEKLEET